jgi:phosphatidylglycerol---prolipoprotein diacylglyceryl transferase
MTLIGPYVHKIDPIMFTVAGVHLWWYGLSYALGFLDVFWFSRRVRDDLGLSTRMVYYLAILVSAGVLLGGRLIEVVFYEWPFYREHPSYIPAYWLGGMATHGLLIGGITGILLFSWIYRKPFLSVSDILVVAGAFTLGAGRIGNFIDGQIIGPPTDVWWAVKFPDAEGFRHPVVLYDGIKNLLLIPVLLWVRKKRPPAGVVTGVFLFLYAFLRIFVDIFREYPTSLLGLATGQSLNILLSVAGLSLLVWRLRQGPHVATPSRDGKSRPRMEPVSNGRLFWPRIIFAAFVLFSLTIPSDWTQDIPARYGKRHPGLHHSSLYPTIDARPEKERHPSGVDVPKPDQPEATKTS